MANTYLTRSTGQAGTSGKKFTISFWMKCASHSSGITIFSSSSNATSSPFMLIQRTSAGKLRFSDYTNDTTTRADKQTNALLRDTSGYYHIVIAVDTDQSTAANRNRIYINGTEETSFATDSNYGSGVTTSMGQNNEMVIGRYEPYNSNHFDGILSHFHYCDGQQYTATEFGETDSTTGEWKIKVGPSVTYGNNGFFVLKDGNSVTDQSGNSNNFTVGAGTLTKTEDSPSNIFATWNPLQATTSASYGFEAGNTRLQVNDVDMSLGSTLAAKTGKYYMEMKWVQQGGNDRWGLQPANTNVNQNVRINGVGWDQATNQFYMLNNAVSGSWGGSIGTSDIIQLAMDLDNGALYLGVNGSYRNSGNPTSGSSKTGAVDFSGTSLYGDFLTFAVGKGNQGTSGWNANFGNGYIEQTAVSSAGSNASGLGIFEYDVPAGYSALCTKGLNE